MNDDFTRIKRISNNKDEKSPFYKSLQEKMNANSMKDRVHNKKSGKVLENKLETI